MTIVNIILILVVIAIAVYVVYYSIKKKQNAQKMGLEHMFLGNVGKTCGKVIHNFSSKNAIK